MPLRIAQSDRGVSDWAVSRWGLISIGKVIAAEGGSEAFKLAWITNILGAVEMLTKKPSK